MRVGNAIDSPEAASCPRCGSEVSWIYADAAKTTVEIDCSDCGRFELPKAEFDKTETDIAAPEPREG